MKEPVCIAKKMILTMILYLLKFSYCLYSSDTSDASSEKSCTDVSRVKGDLASSTKVEQSTVQFYDHGNRFANSYPCEARVERVVPHVHEVSCCVCVYIITIT